MMVTHHTDLQGAVHTDTVKIFQVNKCCTREHHVHHFTKIYAQLNVWEQQGISIAVCLLRDKCILCKWSLLFTKGKKYFSLRCIELLRADYYYVRCDILV